MKIRILRTLGTPRRSFKIGDKITVGKDIDKKTAEAWLKCGAAAEDKSVGKAPETKKSK